MKAGFLPCNFIEAKQILWNEKNEDESGWETREGEEGS